MVQLNARNKQLKELGVTEGMLKQLKSLGHEEASWRNQHELNMHLKWAQDRHAFIQSELDKLLPPKARRTRGPNETPIQSHRTGRPNSGGQMYGERYA
jgi:hypothetical protein